MQRIKKSVTAKKSGLGVSEVQDMIMEMDKKRKEKFPDGEWDDSDSMDDEADFVKSEVSKIINETRALESGEPASSAPGKGDTVGFTNTTELTLSNSSALEYKHYRFEGSANVKVNPSARSQRAPLLRLLHQP